MNVEKMLAEIKEDNAAITGLRRCIAGKEQTVADFLCPFAVGETVLNGTGEKEIVSEVSFSAFSEHYGFSVFKIKKDGTPYKFASRVWHVDKYTKVGGGS